MTDRKRGTWLTMERQVIDPYETRRLTMKMAGS
jgi:hypothetical protein